MCEGKRPSSASATRLGQVFLYSSDLTTLFLPVPVELGRHDSGAVSALHEMLFRLCHSESLLGGSVHDPSQNMVVVAWRGCAGHGRTHTKGPDKRVKLSSFREAFGQDDDVKCFDQCVPGPGFSSRPWLGWHPVPWPAPSLCLPLLACCWASACRCQELNAVRVAWTFAVSAVFGSTRCHLVCCRSLSRTLPGSKYRPLLPCSPTWA